MNSTTEQLLTAALALPDDDRLQFTEALIVSLQPDDQFPFEDSLRHVVQRRSSELHSGFVTSVPWAEVKRQAWEKSGG